MRTLLPLLLLSVGCGPTEADWLEIHVNASASIDYLEAELAHDRGVLAGAKEDGDTGAVDRMTEFVERETYALKRCYRLRNRAAIKLAEAERAE